MTIAVSAILAITGLLIGDPATQPDWHPAIQREYGLKPGEVLKHILPPFIDERLAFYFDTMPSQAAAIPEGPSFITVVWGDTPHIGLCHFGRAEAGLDIVDTICTLARLDPYQVELTPELVGQRMDGDWALQRDASPAQIMNAFAEILSRESGTPIKALQETNEEDVVVAKGAIQFDKDQESKQITLPLEALTLRHDMTGGGATEYLLKALGRCTGYAVIDRTTPQRSFRFCEWGCAGAQAPVVPDIGKISKDDLETLLAAVAAETGLEFTMERQKVTRWQVGTKK